MKKLVFIMLIIFAIVINFAPKRGGIVANAETTGATTSKTVESTIESLVDGFDFSEIDGFLDDEQLDIFENKSIKESIKDIIVSGDGLDFLDVFQIVIKSASSEIENVIKLVALIVAIVGFGAFSEMLKNSSRSTDGISGIINYFLITIIMLIVTTIIADFVSQTTIILNKIKTLVELVFPVLLSILVTVGGVKSSAVFQPSVVVLTGVVFKVITALSSTVITIILVLSVVGELTDSLKLDKLKGFISSTFKWILGLVFTIFMGHLALSGITAGGADKISIKTAKYAIKSYIPLVGGYMSDGYEIFRMGSVLIKNSLGMVGVIILFSLVIGKVVTLIVYNLGFKLASGLAEPMGMNKVTRFLSSLSSVFNLMIASIVSCFLLSVLTIIIIMSSANVV